MNKLFFFIFSIVVIAIVFIVFIIPDYNELQKTKADVVLLEKNIEIIKGLEDSREVLEKQRLSVSANDIERLTKLIPSSPDNIRLIIQLDEIAKRNGLTTLKNVSYDSKTATLSPGQEEDTASDYRSYEMRFNTSGQYTQFLLFLEEIEKNLRLVDIVSVDLKNSEKENSGPALQQDFEITLKAYWLSQSYE